MLSYSGINAKIKAMRSRLLDYGDYENLSKLSSVEEVASKLKEFDSYQEALKTLEGADLHRSSIEQKLVLSLMNDFSRIYKFISDFGYRNYAAAFFLEYEMNILKLILGMVYDERDIVYTLPELNVLLGKHLKVDAAKLISSKTVPEFIDNIKGTEFHPLLEKAYAQTPTLFELEAKLDVYYYVHLWRLQNKCLDKKNREVMKVINGTEIDLRNLMWLYRFKTYYNVSDSAIYGYLIPIKYHLTQQQIAKMAEAKSRDEFLSEFMNVKYGKELAKDGKLERNFYSIMANLHKSTEAKNPNSVVPAVRFLFSKNNEIRNLTSLLECVRYKLKPEETLKLLCIHDEGRLEQ